MSELEVRGGCNSNANLSSQHPELPNQLQPDACDEDSSVLSGTGLSVVSRTPIRVPFAQWAQDTAAAGGLLAPVAFGPLSSAAFGDPLSAGGSRWGPKPDGQQITSLIESPLGGVLGAQMGGSVCGSATTPPSAWHSCRGREGEDNAACGTEKQDDEGFGDWVSAAPSPVAGIPSYAPTPDPLASSAAAHLGMGIEGVGSTHSTVGFQSAFSFDQLRTQDQISTSDSHSEAGARPSSGPGSFSMGGEVIEAGGSRQDGSAKEVFASPLSAWPTSECTVLPPPVAPSTAGAFPCTACDGPPLVAGDEDFGSFQSATLTPSSMADQWLPNQDSALLVPGTASPTMYLHPTADGQFVASGQDLSFPAASPSSYTDAELMATPTSLRQAGSGANAGLFPGFIMARPFVFGPEASFPQPEPLGPVMHPSTTFLSISLCQPETSDSSSLPGLPVSSTHGRPAKANVAIQLPSGTLVESAMSRAVTVMGSPMDLGTPLPQAPAASLAPPRLPPATFPPVQRPEATASLSQHLAPPADPRIQVAPPADPWIQVAPPAAVPSSL